MTAAPTNELGLRDAWPLAVEDLTLAELGRQLMGGPEDGSVARSALYAVHNELTTLAFNEEATPELQATLYGLARRCEAAAELQRRIDNAAHAEKRPIAAPRRKVSAKQSRRAVR